MEEKAVLDRIEVQEHAVLLVGDRQRERVIPVSALPAGTTPGQWLKVRFDGDTLIAVTIDSRETEEVRQRVEDKLAKLRHRGRQGDL